MERATTDPLDALLRDRSVRSVYQPVVRLDDGDVIGFEALARGPRGSELENPESMFIAARAANRVAELDALCMTAAFAGAGDRLADGQLLFVNVEPSTLSSAVIERAAPLASTGCPTIVLEVTERAIASAPGALLAGVRAARQHGWRIALDDVGVEVASLAFLSVIRPDIVKLDMSLIRNRSNRDLGRTMAAVMAYAERSGAILLAEGIETDAHLERAVSLGAGWGQGYRFGRPGELPATSAIPSGGTAVMPPPERDRTVSLSPYDAAIAAGLLPRMARKHVLLQISHNFEEQALADASRPLLLAAFQEARNFTADTARRYRLLADRLTFCAALGVGMTSEPVAGVRGAAVGPDDPLAGEWSVVVLGPHYSGALLARDLGDRDEPEGDRRFSYVVTHRRAVVEAAAESLLRRVLVA